MALVILLFLVALMIWALPDPRQFLRLLGEPSSVPPLGWIAAAAVTVGYAAYTLWALPVVRSLAVELSWFRALAVPLAILSGLIEELFFRQFLMDTLDAWGQGLLLQTVVSAGLFSFVHMIWVLFARDWRILLPVFVSTFVLGGLMSGVFLASDRIVLPAVLAHIAINLVIEPGLLHNATVGSRPTAHDEGQPGGLAHDA